MILLQRHARKPARDLSQGGERRLGGNAWADRTDVVGEGEDPEF